jgi:hypothetical protein
MIQNCWLQRPKVKKKRIQIEYNGLIWFILFASNSFKKNFISCKTTKRPDPNELDMYYYRPHDKPGCGYVTPKNEKEKGVFVSKYGTVEKNDETHERLLGRPGREHIWKFFLSQFDFHIFSLFFTI